MTTREFRNTTDQKQNNTKRQRENEKDLILTHTVPKILEDTSNQSKTRDKAGRKRKVTKIQSIKV